MPPSTSVSFLPPDSRIAGIIRTREWGATPLGPLDAWPMAVKSALSTWLDSPQAMLLAWGPDLRLFFNDAYLPFLGARGTDALGEPFAQVWSDVWASIEPIVRKALAGEGSRFEDMPLTMTRNGYPEATWWTFTYMPLRDAEGNVLGMLCTTADTTGAVLSAQRAQRERIQQQRMLQQMPGFVGLLSGPDHVYEYVNDAYRAVAGARDFVGRRVSDVLPELVDQGFVDLLDKAYASGEPFVAHAMPIRFAGAGGTAGAESFIDLLYHPLHDDEGAVSGIFVGGYDVTERVNAERAMAQINGTLEQRVEARTAELVRAQDALRQAQKLEAVGQLTGGVAHDFNNLLTVIGSSVELLRRQNLPEERRKKYIDAIGDTVRRASKLTSQLLAFARRQPLSPEVFDVGRQVDAIADLVRPLTGVRIAIDLSSPADACFAEADINQFETALVNLAVNARDAMGGEGRLSIDVRAVEGVPAARGLPARVGAYVAVAVRDTGSGIAADKLEAIFEPFFTTKEVGKGTGLGLSQVFGFAQQSGGDVQVASAPGEGATFTLYLPRAAHLPARQSAAPRPDETHDMAHGTCVLVVEDNVAVGQFSTEMLNDLGYQTVWATDAAQALAILQEGDLKFDLVFSDVIMPGMNGVDLARTVRDRYPGLPVVLTSGYSNVLAEEGLQGFELIQKPYSVEALSRVIRQAIAKRAMAG